MYNDSETYYCPYYNYMKEFLQNLYSMYNNSDMYRCNCNNNQMCNPNNNKFQLKDYGPKPFVVNIEKASEMNRNYRTTLWTGKHLQLTLMSIPVGGEIGLEIHRDVDQFIRIESGNGIVKMGDSKKNLDFQKKVSDDYAILIPAGKWHNLINTGNEPIKLYALYAPPEHPYNTVHKTKKDSDMDENN